MSLLTLLIVIALLTILLGGYGSVRGGWGYAGWSPLGFILLLTVALWVGGYLH